MSKLRVNVILPVSIHLA